MKNYAMSFADNKTGNESLKPIFRIALVVLALLATISIVKGFQNAIINSQDFQWSPARLLMNGINPYQVSLDGNKDGSLLLTQEPNYLHLLYILFIPLGFLEWNTVKPVWAIINVVLGFLCVYFIARSGSKISSFRLLAILLIFLCSTPFRNTVSNGQQALWILFFSYLGWSMRSSLVSAPLFSIGYVKYSFAPPIVLWLLLEKKFKLVLASFIFLGITWILFSVLAHTDPLQTILQPLQVSAKGVGVGTADIMSISKVFSWDKYVFRGTGYALGLALAAALTLYLKIFCKHLEDEDIFAGLGVISLLSFFHLGYDFVFLLPVFCRAFFLDFWRRVIVFAGVGYFWFVLRIFMIGEPNYPLLVPINFFICSLIFVVFTSYKSSITRPIPSAV